MKTEEIQDIDIRTYRSFDYTSVIELYKKAGLFDPETDSKERLDEKISRDPESILIAEDGKQIVGSVSIIEDGRIAILFRLVSKHFNGAVLVRSQLLWAAERYLLEKDYKEVHIIVHEEDAARQKEIEGYGFQKGNEYLWFWKKIDSEM